MDISNWETQLYKGVIELLVLLCIQEQEMYGGAILQKLRQANCSISEGTLYPLLNRMQRNGWLVSRWQTETQTGHPRRYYAISPESLEVLPSMKKQVLQLTSTLEELER